MHPNIPAMDEGVLPIIFRRVGLVVFAAIAPELVGLLAIRQWIIAGRLRDEYRDTADWTRTHGFFALMGGFVICKPYTKPEAICLDPDEPYDVDPPRITEGEIQDRSKTNFVAKAIALVHLTWFLCQCISRWAQGLAVTQLEILALAFVIISAVTYGFWWSKPSDVRYPVRVSGETLYKTSITNDIEDIIWQVLLFPVKIIRIPGGEDYNPSLSRVPTFYPPLERDIDQTLVNLIGFIVGSTFGAIHCLAWSFHFPSDNDQTIWRVASLVITGVPAPMALMSTLRAALPRRAHFWNAFVITILVLFSLAYAGARGAVLVVAARAFMSLPPSAYQTVPWTKYFPHWV